MDRNNIILHANTRAPGRSLRGNVDRNTAYYNVNRKKGKVVPYVGTWIEILLPREGTKLDRSRSLRGNVDRNVLASLIVNEARSVVPYVGTWIEIIKIPLRNR